MVYLSYRLFITCFIGKQFYIKMALESFIATNFSKFPIMYLQTSAKLYTHTLLVKQYNDLLDRQSSERGKDEVTYFYVGDVFVYT